MNSLAQDLRYALRQLRKSPGFTFVVIITLALGIGATTAIVSVVDSVLLRSANYQRPDQLVSISGKGPSTRPDEINEVSAGDFTVWQAQAPVFVGMAAYQPWEFHALSGGSGEPDEVWASPVTTNLFQVLGVNAFLGRTFAPNETQAVILSHQYWRSHFASDPKILGTTITLDGKLYWIIGIAPQDFEFPAANAQMWTPLTFIAADRANHEDRDLRVVARLNPGSTLHQAQAVMDTVAARVAAQSPNTNFGWTASVIPFKSRGIGDGLRDTIFALLGAVIFNLIETQALNHISINLPVLGFVAALSLFIGISVGLLPALKASRIDLSEWLKEHGRAATRGGSRLQGALVICEIALALVLLVGAGLMIQSFRLLSAAPTGFDPEHLLTVRLPLMGYKYSPGQSADFYRDVLRRIRSIPGVKSAGLANNLPFAGFNVTLNVPAPSNAPGDSGGNVGVDGRSISPGYFEAMGTPFVAGRDFTEDENRTGARCVRIVNQAMARLYWPNENAVGQQLRGVCPKDAVGEIVGVVADSNRSRLPPRRSQNCTSHTRSTRLLRSS